MIKSEFRYIDRGKLQLAVLLPGWATDHHVFNRLNIDYNYLILNSLNIKTFEQDLLQNLKWGGATLVGWSLGAAIGMDFMVKYPELIKKGVFLCVKEKYPAKDIEKMRKLILKDKSSYLDHFYKKCLSGQSTFDMIWFNTYLKKYYVKYLQVNDLIEHLEYLSSWSLPVDALYKNKEKILFVYGNNDAIVSSKDYNGLKSIFGASSFLEIEDQGHMPFLSNSLKDMI